MGQKDINYTKNFVSCQEKSQIFYKKVIFFYSRKGSIKFLNLKGGQAILILSLDIEIIIL